MALGPLTARAHSPSKQGPLKMATSFVCRVMYPNNGLGTYDRIYSSDFPNVSGEYTCTVLTKYKESRFGKNNICLKLERRSKPRTTAIVPVTDIRSNPSNKEHCQISIGDIYRVANNEQRSDVLYRSTHYDSYKSSFGVSQHFCRHSGLPKCSYNLQQLHVLSSELTKCIVASVTSPSFQQTVASTKDERLEQLREYYRQWTPHVNDSVVFRTKSNDVGFGNVRSITVPDGSTHHSNNSFSTGHPPLFKIKVLSYENNKKINVDNTEYPKNVLISTTF